MRLIHFRPSRAVVLGATVAMLVLGAGAGNDFAQGLTVSQTAALAGLVLPLIVALVTKSAASNLVKGLTLTTLSAVGAAVALLAATNAPETVTIGVLITTFVTTFVTGVGTYFGLVRNTTLDERLLPDHGIG